MRFRSAPVTVLRLGGLACLAACAVACAPGPRSAGAVRTSALRGETVRLGLDPTVLGSRLVPLAVPDDAKLGVEPGGGVRCDRGGSAGGLAPRGAAVVAADERLAGSKWEVTALPAPPRRGVSVRGGRANGLARREVARAGATDLFRRGLHRSACKLVGGASTGVYLLAGSWRAIDPVTRESRRRSDPGPRRRRSAGTPLPTAGARSPSPTCAARWQRRTPARRGGRSTSPWDGVDGGGAGRHAARRGARRGAKRGLVRRARRGTGRSLAARGGGKPCKGGAGVRPR